MNAVVRPTLTCDDMEAYAPVVDLPLDEGIKPYVLALRSGGVETFESCEGGEGHAFKEPAIRFHGGVGEGFRAYGIACQLGLPVAKVSLAYPVDSNGMLTGPWWEMTFITKAGQ